MRSKVSLIATSAVLCLAVSACGSGETGAAADKTNTGGSSASETFGAVRDDEAAALVPEDVQGKELANAVYNDYPPEMFQIDGELTGIQVDFANAIAVVLDVDIKNTSTGSFDSIIPGLASGRYALATSAFGITAERVEQVDFVPHFDIGTGFAVKEGSSLTLADKSDMCGLSVGVLQGSYFVQQVEAIGQECLDSGAEDVKLDQFPTASAGVLALQNGRVEVYAASQDSLAYTAEETGSMSIQELVDATLPQGFAFPKDSGLTEAVVAAMESMHETGVYDKILEKWGIESLAYDDTSAFEINRTTPVA